VFPHIVALRDGFRQLY